ncbi:TonB-dependent receptor domain-containing protein [candidate division CSSED10-310 bacterium]|uniref:TonB-dependent receptor domain-containing protein n=1 Tax=candidate division CSSED10-310 bacterium TaxID=2855610 RepID=A0ABV6Z1L0_UNCC1
MQQASNKWSFHSLLYYRNATVMDDTIAYITQSGGENKGQVGYFRPNDLIGFENQVDFTPFTSVNFIAGLVWEEERLSSGFSKSYSGSPDQDPPTPEKPDMMTNHKVSGYFQTQLKIISYTELTVGFRHDDSSYFGKVDTPRFGLVFNRNLLTAKLLWMYAYRAPKPWDFTDGLGNSDLKPEKMRSFETTIGYTFFKRLRSEICFYQNLMDDHLVKEEIGEDWRWINGGTANTDGLEVIMEYVKDPVKMYFNYTYNASRLEEGGALPEIAYNNANVGISYAFRPDTKLDIRGNYLGERKNVMSGTVTGKDTIPDAFIINSTLTFLNCKNFDVYLMIKNLTDEKYYHSSNRPVEKYRQPQRSILLRAEFRF